MAGLNALDYLILPFLLAVMVALPAAAGEINYEVVNGLASVLGSEQACGLKYDQAAIERYVTSNVGADDMSFPAVLKSMTDGIKAQIAGMSESELTAQCTQVRRTAKHYGFVR
jgi:hypothetical protein